MRSLIKFASVFLIACASICSAQSPSGILPSNRYTDWSKAGIVGGIPSDSWTQCGPTLSTSATAAQISAAMAHTGAGYTGCSANTYIQLAAGTFNISPICFKNLSGTELRGMGANQTFLVFSTTINCQGGGANVSIGFEDNNGESTCCGNTAVAITAGLSQGSTSITIANAATLGIVANQTVIVADWCDTGFSGATTASNTYSATCASGSSIDNGAAFDAGAAYVPTANDSGTSTVSGGVNVTGTGFSSAFGNILNLDGISYLISAFNSPTSITLSSLTPAPNGSHSSAFPTGSSYNASNGKVARNNRWQEEFHLVTACSPNCSNAGSTVLTLATPIIHASFGNNPEAWAIQANSNVGIRDLTIQAAGTAANPALDFNDLQNCWAKGVSVQNAKSQGIGLYGVNACEILSSYVYNSGQSVSGTDPNPNDPSGIDFNGSHILIDNNIIQWSRICTIPNGPASGNVIAYNFGVNSFESNGDLWGCWYDGHQNGTDYNLYEGNIGPQYYQDQTHGGKLFETLFRNLFTGWESCSNGNCSPSATQKNANVFAVAPLSSNRYTAIIDNVLGTPGITSLGYVYTNANQFVSNTTGYVYNLASGNPCSPGGGCAGGPMPIDPIVLLSTMRWGNWDAFNSATLECTAASTPIAACTGDERSVNAPTFPGLASPSTSFPASFYLSARPSWWSSSIPFPAIGSDVTGGNVGQCGGTVNASGQFALVPATSSSSCAGHGLNTAWSGHVNAIPAMACFLNVMSGPPDGTGSALTFNAATCYPPSVAFPAPASPFALMLMKIQ